MGAPLSRLSSFPVCLSLRVFSSLCWTGGWAPPRPPERPGMVGSHSPGSLTTTKLVTSSVCLVLREWAVRLQHAQTSTRSSCPASFLTSSTAHHTTPHTTPHYSRAQDTSQHWHHTSTITNNYRDEYCHHQLHQPTLLNAFSFAIKIPPAGSSWVSVYADAVRRRDLASRDTPSRHLIIRGGQSSVFIFNYIYIQPTLGREQKTLQIGPTPPPINTDSCISLMHSRACRPADWSLIIIQQNWVIFIQRWGLGASFSCWVWWGVKGQHLFIFVFKVKSDSVEPVSV